MSRIRILAAAFVLVSCSCFGAGEKEGPESVDQRWQKAMRANDVDAVMACYASDATAWLSDSAPAKGSEAIRGLYMDMLKTNNVTEVNLTNTHVHTCGNMAMAWGEYTFTLTPKAGGSAVTATGRYTEVLRKEGNKWVYAVDHASANPAAPSPTP